MISAFKRIVTAFSIARNKKRLIYQDPEMKDLNFIDAVRIQMMFSVVMGNCFILYSMLPLSNPQFYEEVRILS